MESITENMKRNVNRIASGIDEVIINQLRQEIQEEKREREEEKRERQAMLEAIRAERKLMIEDIRGERNMIKQAEAEQMKTQSALDKYWGDDLRKTDSDVMTNAFEFRQNTEYLEIRDKAEAEVLNEYIREHNEAKEQAEYEAKYGQTAIDEAKRVQYEQKWQSDLEAYKRKKEEEATQASYAEEDAYVKAHEPEVLAISAQKQARNDLEARTAKAQSKQSKDMAKALKQAEKEITPEKVSATVRKLDDLNDHIDNLMNVINGLSVQVAQLQNYVKTGQTAEEYMDGNGFILGASYNELYGKGGKS